MPCFGASGLSSKGFHLTATSCRSKRASAFSRRRFPIKHHGQTTSETTSMTDRTPAETSTTSEVLRDSRSGFMTTIRPPGAARGRVAEQLGLVDFMSVPQPVVLVCAIRHAALGGDHFGDQGFDAPALRAGLNVREKGAPEVFRVGLRGAGGRPCDARAPAKSAVARSFLPDNPVKLRVELWAGPLQ